MSVRRTVALILACALVAGTAGCRAGLFRQYEYEEEIYLKLDGSADVVINTSIPALVALRGADLSTDPSATVDRDKVRSFYESPETSVTRISRSWRRFGRRFVQVRLNTPDVRTLGRALPFSWASYRFDQRGGLYVYRQTLGAASGSPSGGAGWTGSELVTVRLHVPSKIHYHNAPSREVERGNILRWEQTLSERLAGKPLDVEVRMETDSILARTLLIFGVSAAAALTLLVGIVVWVRRSGRPSAG